MPNRRKQLVVELRRTLGRRLGSPTGQLGGLLLAGFLAVGVSGSFAGSDEKGGERRWVIGSLVNLRTQPALDAEVVKRLALNTEVDLLATLPGGHFCEVAVIVGGVAESRGFTACQYLGSAPLSKRKISQQYRDDGTPNPDYNPQQAFWLAPSYEALSAYGEYLEETRLTAEERGAPAFPRAAVAEFERMKAYLAKGIYGPAAKAYPAWDEMKRSARQWEKERQAALTAKLRKYATDPDEELRIAAARFQPVQSALGTYDIDVVKTLGLVNAIELPTVKSSLFQNMDELAPPSELAEQVSGRFRIVHAVQTHGREIGRGEDKWNAPGTWDVGRVSKSLTRPVIRNVLFRDGAILASATHLKRSFIEWSESDGPMCDGYTDGYAFGDSDPRIWTGYGIGDEAYRESLKRNPKHSLLYFYTRTPLPEQQAAVSATRQTLDRDATGFVAATTFLYDLNGDGIPDLAVWEGSGRAQGHLGGVPETDDAYQRLFFANVAGRWRVFGRDSFGYGCGC